MHFAIRDDRNVLPPLQELHHLLCFSRHLGPARCRTGVLFESSQFSSFELEIELFEFSLCCWSNREGFVFERDYLLVFDQRLLIDG